MTYKAWPILFGNMLEFYEFTLFAVLLPIIAPILFPSAEILTSFTSGYIFLAIGFLARPIGAVFFGYIGDHYGRKRAVLISILLMSFSTITIGLLPSYQLIGSYVLLILALCRIFQGFSAGGEYSGAGLLMVEKASAENRFLNGAVLCAAGVFGAFIAATLAALISGSFFPKESWRFLFLMGGGLGLVTLWFRFSMTETLPRKIHDSSSKSTMSWLTILKKYKTSFVCAISIESLMNIPFYLTIGFMNTYLSAIGTYSKTTLMLMNAFVLLCTAGGLVYCGFLSRRFNPIKMMLYASFGITVFAFPFFLLVNSDSFILFFLAEISLLLLSMTFNAPAFATMAQLFPAPIRYRGMALASCLGLAIFGGSTPYICMQLIQYTGLSWSPAIYLCVMGFLGFISVMVIRRGSKYLEGEAYNLNALQTEGV